MWEHMLCSCTHMHACAHVCAGELCGESVSNGGGSCGSHHLLKLGEEGVHRTGLGSLLLPKVPPAGEGGRKEEAPYLNAND